MQNFVGVLGFLLPRHLFFSAMFTVMLVLYPILYPPDFSTHNIVAFIFGGFTVAIVPLALTAGLFERFS